jgi:transposase
VQYASADYRSALADHGLIASMSRRGNCYDNAAIESFWSSLKNELVHRRRFATRADALTAIFDFIESFCNRYRSHSLTWLSKPVRLRILPQLTKTITRPTRVRHSRGSTTHQLYGRFRARVVQLTLDQSKPFNGEVEIDESYFGARRVRGKRVRGAIGKIPVVGLLKRGGCVYVKIVDDCSRDSLRPIIKGQVLINSTIYTDDWMSFNDLVLDGYRHHRIHHHKNEFARGKNHVNGIESFCSFVKLRMAKMRGLRKAHFLGHLLESQ